MKIDWKRKLTSRKFWLALASFVTLIVIAFGASEESASQLAAIIMAGATVIGYVIGEGLTDASAIEAQTDALEDKDELQ
jgi:small-conductance mechanosensitive channel